MANRYPYKGKKFYIALNEGNEVQVMLGSDQRFMATVSAKNAGGQYYVTGPDNRYEEAETPEKALDKACETILNEIEIDRKENEAETRLLQYYNAQELNP